MQLPIPSFRRLRPLSALALATAIIFYGCSSGPQDIDVDAIHIDLKVMRLEQDMRAAAEAYRPGSPIDSVSSYLKHFQKHRPFITDWMFMGHDEVATDSVLTVVMHDFLRDHHGRDLLDSVQAHLGTYDPTPALTDLFKRYHHHFPDKVLPVIVTYVDGYPPTAQQELDQVFISPRFLGIGIHYFLGPHFTFYPPDMPLFIRRRCTPEYLPSVVAHKIADVSVPEPDLAGNPVLIDYVIAAGIRQHLIDQILGPNVPDSVKFFYTTEQMEWANYFEGKAFKDMMPDIYDVDPVKLRRYMDDSPFTSQLNRGSAPRLGQFIGLKIVQAYMARFPETKMPELVAMKDYQQIFKKAKYRPEAKE